MLQKTYTSAGQKVLHIESNIDRSLPYKSWLRTFSNNGMFLDVDMIKWKTLPDGTLKPVLLTEITTFEGEEKVSQSYLDAITNRYFVREKQGAVTGTIGRLLNIPCYIVFFQKELKWFFVYSFRKKEWREFTKETLMKFIQQF